MLPFSSLPYPGLRPFRDYESDIFFGREEQTDELLARLDRCRFIAVTGASGCGKSSLVKAGMIPALNAGFIAAAGSRWRICELRPGDMPLRRLTHALARPEILGSGHTEQSAAFVEAALRRGPLGLIEVARGAEALQDVNLLVLVDQFEEIFRNRERITFDEADAFIALLLAAAHQSEVAIYVVITMRSDYLGECAMFHGLPEAVSDSQYLTPRLTREELEEAIAGPARVFGGRIDPKLVNRLINDFGTEADQLPLLQHALARMWERFSKSSASPLLTVENYTEIGGLAALSSHGDEIYDELTPQQQRVAEVLFKRLSGSEEGRRDVRCPARVDEVANIAAADPDSIIGEVIAVADAFRRPDRCFLAVPEGPVHGNTLLDLSHESLIRQWRKLAGWVADEAKSAEMYRRLRDSARRREMGASELWRGADLESAAAWWRRAEPSPAWTERYRDHDQPDNQFALTQKFLAASEQAEAAALAAEETQRRRQLQRARRVAYLSAFAAAGLVAAILAYHVVYVWKHDAYYKSYVDRWGIPQGIGNRLSATEAKHRSTTYKITTAGVLGHVLSIEAVDPTDRPVNGMEVNARFSPGEEAAPVSRQEYGYDATGQVAYEIFFDRQRHVVARILYMPFPTSRHEPGEKRFRYAYLLDKRGALARQISSCAAYLKYEYSNEGYRIKEDYLNRAGNPTPGKDNAFAKQYMYDENGRQIKEISLSSDNRPMNDLAGNAEMDLAYDNEGNIIAEEVLDAAGQPIDLSINEKKWQRETLKYDALSNLVEETFWHADGTPAEDDGCHSRRHSYDQFGNIRHTLCSVSGDPQGKSGFQSTDRPKEAGFTAWEYKFDQAGRLEELSFFDRDGNPVEGPDGGIRVRYSYDEDGNVTETSYFDKDGKPSNGSGRYHAERTTFENGHPLRTEYLDVEGKLAELDGGYAAIQREYDADGNEARTTHLDASGQPVASLDNEWVIKEASFDACGREVVTQLSGKGGHHPALVKKTYDENNRVTDEICEGPSCSVYKYDDHEWTGYARIIEHFNSRGNLEEEAYFDSENSPTKGEGGYARHTRHYDNDRLLEEAYFGTNGALVLSDGGWARITYAYDEHGRGVEWAYYGTDGKPIILKDGYAKLTRRYDDHGAVAEEAYFGTSGEPVLISDGWARITLVNDERGRPIERAHFGVHGEPVVGTTEAYQRATRRLDDRGNMLELALFGTDGQPIDIADPQNNRRCARFVFHYGADGQRTSSDCFDARDNPVALATTE